VKNRNKKKKEIQISKNFKIVDIAKALKRQNEIRKKYGLKPLKRLYPETVLYLPKDNTDTSEKKSITLDRGGMYQ